MIFKPAGFESEVEYREGLMDSVDVYCSVILEHC